MKKERTTQDSGQPASAEHQKGSQDQTTQQKSRKKRLPRITLAKADDPIFQQGWRFLSRPASAMSSHDGGSGLMMGGQMGMPETLSSAPWQEAPQAQPPAKPAAGVPDKTNSADDGK
jgi:hypothetical protein